jgi:predicted aconitase
MFTSRLHQTTQIRRALFATTVALAFVGPAHADGLRPIEAKSIDLGGVSGVAYYTVERDGFHVVTTLAEGEAGTTIRVVSILSQGSGWFSRHRHQRAESKSAAKVIASSCTGAALSRIEEIRSVSNKRNRRLSWQLFISIGQQV